VSSPTSNNDKATLVSTTSLTGIIKKNDKKTNNDLQNITIKIKDQIRQIPLKLGVNSGASEEWAVPAPLVAHTLLNNVI
jgi:hypothetical protein